MSRIRPLESVLRQFIAMLGASNLTFSLPAAVRLALGLTEGERTLFLAHGPGRSYALRAGMAWVRFEGLSRCGLFARMAQAAEQGPPPRIHALITDIGNDLIYNVPPEPLLEWVERTLDRLLAQGARVAVTAMPFESLRRIPRPTFYFFRTLYYPCCRVPHADMLRRVETVRTGLEDLCAARGLSLLPAPGEWYGLDRIHLRLRQRHVAYRQWLETLFERQLENPLPQLACSNLKLWRHPPSSRWPWGLRQREHTQLGFPLAPNAHAFFD